MNFPKYSTSPAVFPILSGASLAVLLDTTQAYYVPGQTLVERLVVAIIVGIIICQVALVSRWRRGLV